MRETMQAERHTSPFSRSHRASEPVERVAVERVVAEPTPASNVDAADLPPTATLEPELLDLRPAQVLAGELRAMTGFEEELVEDLAARLDRESADTASICNELLARCLVAPGSEPSPRQRARVRELCVAERDLALVVLRRLSYGDTVETLTECPACGVTNEVRFDLRELPLELADIPGRVRVALGERGAAELRLPNAGDQAELLAAGIESLARRRSWLLARVLLRLGEQSGPFTIEQLHCLPVALRRGLEQALERALPELDLGMDVRCHACAHEWQSPFEMESFFLLS